MSNNLFPGTTGWLAARLWYLAPVVGIGAFGLLYVVATLLYPGGSPAHPLAPGFSWLHNYWCNLLNARAVNGAINPAQPVALTAMGVLGISLALFWWQLPGLFLFGPRGAAVIRWAGTLAMFATCFLATAYHDTATTIASVLGLIALLGTFIGLRRLPAWQLFWVGIGCVVLIGANNFIYYTGYALRYLPLLQKITMVWVLGWMIQLSLRLFRKSNPTQPVLKETS